jgi:hypothetical protein
MMRRIMRRAAIGLLLCTFVLYDFVYASLWQLRSLDAQRTLPILRNPPGARSQKSQDSFPRCELVADHDPRIASIT